MRYANSCKTFSAFLLILVSYTVTGQSVGHGEAARVTVSGISSGGYMAVQAHVALADQIDGAAIIAGGPYRCAEGSIALALSRCISGAGLDVTTSVKLTRKAENMGQIAPLAHLNEARVWIFHGKQDTIVSSKVSTALRDFYREFVSADGVALVDSVPAAHAWPTIDRGEECGQMGPTFMNACGYDAAGRLLEHLYGPLNPPTTAVEKHFSEYDQTTIAEAGSHLSKRGFIYLPERCSKSGKSCRLHIAFHGCRQGREFTDNRFAVAVGLNEWAESNDIVVLYPQVESSLANPQGCWDWWGYTGTDYDQHSGKQVASVAALIRSWSE